MNSGLFGLAEVDVPDDMFGSFAELSAFCCCVSTSKSSHRPQNPSVLDDVKDDQ